MVRAIENNRAGQSAERTTRNDAVAEWWRGAVIYQIYPRSFFDSNDDGIGDLSGIVRKLDYVAELNVDAIWVSPFFCSPMKDFGYDVSDYRRVDPIFGDLDDFDALVAAAHERDLKLIIDQVLSHSSDEHAWFAESRKSRTNEYADWYVWADPRPDGTPPNNWLSIFGGSAWQWESQREQYYLHNFLPSQPDLNYHQPAVAEQMLSELKFWLDRGVDGFRLDAINFCYHDDKLRDNPPKPPEARRGRGFRTDNPYAWQRHIYDNTRPENIDFLRRIRALCEEYGDVVTLGEIASEDTAATVHDYTCGDDRLHMAYNFELLVDEFSVAHIRESIEQEKTGPENGWPCRAIGNHDVARVASRWGGTQPSSARLKLLNALPMVLRGTVCTYQGEELGLTEAPISREQVRDPYGLEFWPRFKGRDGCRTPMPWCPQAPAAGFSEAEPWLPTPSEHRASSIATQAADTDSVLSAYRQFVAWRRQQPALLWGDIQFLSSAPDGLALIRATEDQCILAAFNFGCEALHLAVDDFDDVTLIDGHGFSGAKIDQGRLTVPAMSAGFGIIARRFV